jgi:VirE N-terminal domain.
LIELQEIAQRIRCGSSKVLIDQIRAGNKDLKKKLPSICFAGEFLQRNRKGLQKHAGLMVVDFDKYPDKNIMLDHLAELKQNSHFVLLFISPSGLGIKGVVKIPTANKDTHPQYFKAFQEKYKFDYFDMANSNVDRVCFESYDPNIYENYNAETFDVELVDKGYKRTENIPLLPISNEDVIVNRIMDFNWKKRL